MHTYKLTTFRIFLLLSIYAVLSQTPKRQYTIVADFFRGIKAREFSIYDKSGKHLQYRIESKYHIFQKIELVSYPSKAVIGRLQANFKLLLYDASFEVYDEGKNQWSKGTINQNFQWLGANFTIKWNNHLLTMETEPISFTTNIFDNAKDQHELVATYRMKGQSLIWVKKYEMDVYSTEIPDSVYLLGLAARDHLLRTKKSG